MGPDSYLRYISTLNVELVELLGVQYVIDYVLEKAKEETKLLIYKSYVSDLLKAISEAVGAEVKKRYYDIINPPKETGETADEIALRIIKNAGLKVK